MEQPIFNPVVSEEYTPTIARDWKVKHSGQWLRDQVRGLLRTDFLDRYEARQSRAAPSWSTGSPARTRNGWTLTDAESRLFLSRQSTLRVRALHCRVAGNCLLANANRIVLPSVFLYVPAV